MSNDMEIIAEITQNTHSLLAHFLFEAILTGSLFIIMVLVSIGVLVLVKEMALWKRLTLLICSIAMFIVMSAIEIHTVSPIYLDYTEQSYLMVEDVTIEVQGGATGRIVKINDVILYNDDYTDRLKIENGFLQLDTNTEFKGTIVYLNHSRFIVWCDVE